MHTPSRAFALGLVAVLVSRGAVGARRYRLAGSASHTLMSSKEPSLPATPSSIFDLIGCAMPDDLRYPAGLPSMVTRISSPTVSTTSTYHFPASSLAG